MRFSAPRAGLNLGLFFVLVGVLLGPYAAFLAIAPGKRHLVAQLFFKGCLALTGIRLTVRGAPGAGAAMYAANHGSYLDIPVLGAAISGGVFVAKSEVAEWPLFGFLARISRTIFITRNGADAGRQRETLAARMNRGSRLILFPEGTSTDGSLVKTFKSSLFAALDDVRREAPMPEVHVQPVSVVYARHKDGRPLSQADRELYTWFGDMTLAPHLFNVFGIKGCEVEVTFHEPLLANAFANRKGLAKACETAVARQLCDTLGVTENCPEDGSEDQPVDQTIGVDRELEILMSPTPIVSAE